jgi:DNA modification methylase
VTESKAIQSKIIEEEPVVKRYKMLYTNQLKPYHLRDVRPHTVDRIVNNIKENGFYDAKVLSVVPDPNEKDQYIVADGNHRYYAIQEVGIPKVPCVIFENADIVEIAVKGNSAEDVYAPMDLFDWLDIIKQLKSKGLTQQEIGDKIGWSRSKVGDYQRILNETVAKVLDFCKDHQKDRETKKVSDATFDFTEGWFRSSGLYDLNPLHQLGALRWFIKKKCPSKKILTDKTDKLKEIEEQIELIKEDLNPSIDPTDLLKAVKKGEYTIDRLKDVIEQVNQEAKNRAIFGVNCLPELKKLDTASVDCLITDPPWGVEFKPPRQTDNPEFDKTLDKVLNLLEEVLNECKRVLKSNAHIYIFFPTSFYCEFRALLSKFFHVYPIPIVWYKNNHNPCDFKKRYASTYETIFFCKMENGDVRELNNKVSPDVLEYNKPRNKYHDCQKPVDLIQEFIQNSTGEKESVLDPFAGSGSTLLAAAKEDRFYIGFEKEDSYESEFKRRVGEFL